MALSRHLAIVLGGNSIYMYIYIYDSELRLGLFGQLATEPCLIPHCSCGAQTVPVPYTWSGTVAFGLVCTRSLIDGARQGGFVSLPLPAWCLPARPTMSATATPFPVIEVPGPCPVSEMFIILFSAPLLFVLLCE